MKYFKNRNHTLFARNRSKGQESWFRFELSNDGSYVPVEIDKGDIEYPMLLEEVTKENALEYIKPPKSLEERTAEALAKGCILNRQWSALEPMPEHVQFKVGDSVIIGNLNNCVVAGVSEDRKTVAIVHEARWKKGKDFERPLTRYETEVGVYPWIDVIKIADTTSLVNKEDRERGVALFGSTSMRSLDSIYLGLLEGDIIDNPDYQRDYVWTEDDKIRFIESLLNGYDIGKFVIIENKWPAPNEILDGKQRLKTICDFVQCKFKYKGLYFNEMNRLDRHFLTDRVVSVSNIKGESLSEKDRLYYFLLVNKAGVPQSENHLKKVYEKYEELSKNSSSMKI